MMGKEMDNNIQGVLLPLSQYFSVGLHPGFQTKYFLFLYPTKPHITKPNNHITKQLHNQTTNEPKNHENN